MEKTIKKHLKEIKEKTNNNNIIGYYLDMSYNLDLKNKYLFVSLSKENLKNITIKNVNNYEDVTIINLKNNYDSNISDLIIDYLSIIKNNLERKF